MEYCWKVDRKNLEILQNITESFIEIYIKRKPSWKLKVKKKKATLNISVNIISAWKRNKKFLKNSEVKDNLIFKLSFKEKFITSFMAG